MGTSEDFARLAEDLEKQESLASNDAARCHIYKQLLCIYLHENSLSKARDLWDRIPRSLKNGDPELVNVWAVAECMCAWDFPGTYKALNSVPWSESLADIIKQVEESVRNGAVDLIARAYSRISLERVSAMIGLTPDDCVTACLARGWQVEDETKVVRPVRPAP